MAHMDNMYALSGLPQNSDKFIRLIAFFKSILELCAELGIEPILDGSLALFVYTGNNALNVNDVDLSCPEADFQPLMTALNQRGISYRLREWHVLQVLQDDLKVEFSAIEHWLQNVPLTLNTLQIDDYAVRMMSLSSLREFYRLAVLDRASKSEPNEQRKLADLKRKHALLQHAQESP